MASIAVLGPGGVGGFLAAALARAGEPVAVVGREHTARAIARDGILVQSVRLGEFRAHPEAVTLLEEEVGVLIVATKAVGLELALERVRSAPALVVPLLNGLDHMDVLRRRWGTERVAAGTIRIDSYRPAPGRVVQTSPALRIELAAEAAPARAALPALAAIFERAGVPTELHDSERQILWSKLVRLSALACTTSASDQPIGFIRSDPEWRATLVRCIEEAATVAGADGAQIDPRARLAELDEAHTGLRSSMQRDIAAGREPELDAICGAVLRAARRHGLECPTIARLTEAIARRAGVAMPRIDFAEDDRQTARRIQS